MTQKMGNNPYSALKRVFHEPSRMAIMSELCAGERGLSFGELKAQLQLTDGNLNRHLKALSEAGAIRVIKKAAGAKSRTVVHITDAGRLHFVDYLKALEEALHRAAEALAPEETVANWSTLWQSQLPVR